MALDTRYIPLNFLQQYFVDIATGLPLAGGIVTFYKDQARTQLKDIFQISGTPPNYTYTALPNPLTLSANGTFVDASGNDISVYAFPYDSAGAVELYFVTVYSNLAVFQFSREGLPNTGTQSVSDLGSVVNYVPNGQFLLHNNIMSAVVADIGKVTQAVTVVAPGGWTFERAPGATSTDFVKFTNFGSYITNPPESPRFSIDISCTSTGTGSGIKGLRLKFKDVNKFASDTQFYTLSFFAKNNSGSSADITMRIIKYYGAGGSPTDTIDIPAGGKVITNSWLPYNVQFVFGNNTGKTIGSAGDDYVQIEFGLKPDDIFDLSLTDIVLLQGSVTINSFPTTTENQFTYRSMFGAGPLPTYTGDTIGLPIISTPGGFGYDTSLIGKVFASTNELPELGELQCNGTSYEYDSFSSDGIPYKRLGDKLWDSVHLVYKYGTGLSRFITRTTFATPYIRFINNDPGAVTNIVDGPGASATGFTFTPIHTGTAGYGVRAFMVSTNEFWIQNLAAGVVAGATAGTSGFTVSFPRPNENTPLSRHVTAITVGAMPGAGTYFEFDVPGVAYYVWFTVAGAGADPAVVGRTGIRVNLSGWENPPVIAEKIREALNGWQNEDVRVRPGNVITPNSYFIANSVGHSYYVWYNVNGSGSDPKPSGLIGIMVSITTAMSDAEVALQTLGSVNHKYYAVPDLRGMFLRGWDSSTLVDPDATTRYNYYIPERLGGVGSDELDDFLAHELHVGVGGTYNVEGPNAGAGPVGGRETRPINSAVNYVIKY